MAITVVRQQLLGMSDEISGAVADSLHRTIGMSAPSPEVFGDEGVSTAVGSAKEVLEQAIRAMAGNAQSASELVRDTEVDFGTTDTDVASAVQGAGGSATGGAQ